MKPTQRNPNPVLKEKLSYNDIVWLLIPALLEAAATLGHFQTNTFLLLFKSVQIRFFCHLQKKKKRHQTDLTCTSPAQLWSWTAEGWFFEKVIDAESTHSSHPDNLELWRNI